VLTAIELDDKPMLERHEIDDIAFDRLLAPELRADLART